MTSLRDAMIRTDATTVKYGGLVHEARARAILRQAGLGRLVRCASARAPVTIALLDGPAATAHQTFAASKIVQTTDSIAVVSQSRAVQHATFIASMLVGRGPGVLAICPGCTLLNVPVVDDSMVDGTRPLREVSKRLASGVREALAAGADVILVSLEFSPSAAAGLGEFHHALAMAARSGIRTVMPAGNRPSLEPSPTLGVPGVVPVVMEDWPSGIDHRGTCGPLLGQRGLGAPGVDVPGASGLDGYTFATGTSYAAALVTGAFALLHSLAPRPSRDDVWEALLLQGGPGRIPNLLVPPPLDAEASLAWLISRTKGEDR